MGCIRRFIPYLQAIMRPFRLMIALGLSTLLAGCAGNTRTPFTPESGPPTVGMPASLSERERLFVPDLEAALRNQGLVPVRSGAGDMQLEFVVETGPINTDTRIALLEGSRTVAQGEGRASGLPLVGRSKVAEKSFDRAFRQFEADLRNTGSRRSWSQASQANTDSGEAVY
jgi:hypothetical protein